MNPQQKRRPWIFMGSSLLVVLIMLYASSRFDASITPKQVSYSEFLAQMRSGNFTDVQIAERELVGVLKDDPSHSKEAYQRTIKATRLPGVDESLLLRELDAHSVKFGGHIGQGSWIWSALAWLAPFLFIVLIYGLRMRRITQGGGALTFGKNRAKIHDESSRIQVTFEDVAGVDEAKLELEEVVDFLRQPAKYQKLGGRIPKEVLPVGPPGTGKTLLAKAIAGEAV
jgi:cell division protease FtsH